MHSCYAGSMTIQDSIIHTEVDFASFPGGERIPRLRPSYPAGPLVINQSINSPQDLFDILSVVDALKRMDCWFEIHSLILNAPYIFGGRQDRVCNVGEALTSKVVADVINSCGFDKVMTFYPHSDVLPALINNCEPINDVSTQILKICGEDMSANIVAPDAGATKRAFSLVKKLNSGFNRDFKFVQAGKKRDVATGNITDFTLESEDLEGRLTIVVDDVCANGGTFIGLHKLLTEKNAGQTALFVAHSDHEQGLNNCSLHYGHVYTTKSRPLKTEFLHENITIL